VGGRWNDPTVDAGRIATHHEQLQKLGYQVELSQVNCPGLRVSFGLFVAAWIFSSSGLLSLLTQSWV
jgi:hypothetical protein